jgi:SAM-dependent methyltransferase
MDDLERKTRGVFDPHHREQARSPRIYRRLTSLVSAEYFGLPPGWFEGRVVLDAGCGSNANASYALLELGAGKVCSLDLGSAWMDCARAQLASFADRSVLVDGDVLALGFDDGEFDFVHCAGVLHHTRDPSAGFRELARVTKRGGFTFISVMATGAGIVYQAVNQLRRRYAADEGFRVAVDALDADRLRGMMSWLVAVKEEHEGVTDAEREVISSLFDDDFVLTLKDRLQAPTYHDFAFTEADIRRWFEAAGFEEPRRLTRYTKGFANLRRFFAPLYCHYDHPMSRFLFGDGYVQMIGRKA